MAGTTGDRPGSPECSSGGSGRAGRRREFRMHGPRSCRCARAPRRSPTVISSPASSSAHRQWHRGPLWACHPSRRRSRRCGRLLRSAEHRNELCLLGAGPEFRWAFARRGAHGRPCAGRRHLPAASRRERQRRPPVRPCGRRRREREGSLFRRDAIGQGSSFFGEPASLGAMPSASQAEGVARRLSRFPSSVVRHASSWPALSTSSRSPFAMRLFSTFVTRRR